MPEYFCQCCNFKTIDKSKYTRHTESGKHIELAMPTAVRVDTPPPKTDEIAELRAMVLELSKTVIVLNQKIDTLTSKLESQTMSAPIQQPIKIENPQPIRIEQPIKNEDEHKSEKRMTVAEEKQYILTTCEKLGDDAMEWLTEYVPRQKKPHYEDSKSPYYIIDYFKYDLIAKRMINEKPFGISA
jgi:hypothetical protein